MNVIEESCGCKIQNCFSGNFDKYNISGFSSNKQQTWAHARLHLLASSEILMVHSFPLTKSSPFSSMSWWFRFMQRFLRKIGQFGTNWRMEATEHESFKLSCDWLHFYWWYKVAWFLHTTFGFEHGYISRHNATDIEMLCIAGTSTYLQLTN